MPSDPSDPSSPDDPLVDVSSSWTRMALRRFAGRPSALLGLVLLSAMIVLALLAPLISRYNPDAIDVSMLNQDPSAAHWFGTDYLGRDMWARVVYGGRVSLPAGLGVVIIAFGVGVPLGLIAGYGGKLLDELIMRLVDVLLSIPGILLAIGVLAILGTGLTSAVVAIGVASIPGFARISRASALQVREMGYVEASRAQGAGSLRILVRHILPNIVDPLIVLATLSLGSAILATAALSFLGLGSQPPTSDWGTLLSNGYEHMFQSWSEVTFPGLAIAISVLGINLLGDGLTDALNPRLLPR
jgi:peptide/nickel transport system permease protein